MGMFRFGDAFRFVVWVVGSVVESRLRCRL